MNKNFKSAEEWFNQAFYDFETAEIIFNGGKYIYAVFMCHLSLEKALKGFYAKEYKKDPLKTHDLIYLLESIKTSLNEKHTEFLKILNDLSIPTRYPDELENLLKQYTKKHTKHILDTTNEVLLCLKKNL
jgi:HEPN domain-containing protein